MLIAAVAIAAFAGFSGFGAETARQEKPLRAAVFVGEGARGAGAYRWVEIASTADNVVATPVDGAAIRAGALDNADLLIMPGGNSRIISKDLGEEGHRKVKSFLLNGGGYVGTCAGCCLLMQSDKSHTNMMNIIPYSFSVCGGQADINIAFNDKATKLAGIKKGSTKIRYSGGPVPREVKAKNANATAVVVARYAGNINTVGKKPRESFSGHPAAFACTYGKGKMFVFTVHPEMDVDDHYVIKGAIRYATGRNIDWKYPQRKPGQLATGFMCDYSLGVETAKLVQKLLKEREFDIIPLGDQTVAEGELRHLDAVLVPDNVEKGPFDKGLYGHNTARTKEFIGRGGRVIAWGRAAESAKKHEPKVVCAENAEAALAALRAFAKEVAFYADRGGAQYNVAAMLKVSPGYEPVPMSGKDIADGGLEGMDVLLMPGGGSATESKRLGPKGQDAVRRFVREGGKYYGICAGAFLVRQAHNGLGLIPFRDDKPAHYRGWAPTKLRLTEDGKNVFEGSAEVRDVMYWGGPAFIAGEPVEDSDVKVLAKYEGRLVNTSNPKKVEIMYGKGAIVGGRVGKGKVYAQGPHPEMFDYSMDMVESGFKFLTGVAPKPMNTDRVRGAKSVLVTLTWDETAKGQMDFYINNLVADSRFDVRRCRDVNNNALAHVETVVLLQPAKCNWTKPYDCVHTTLKPKDWTQRIKDFIASGGEVIILADTEEERKSASALKGAKVVGSYLEVWETLLGVCVCF